jgi:hypothetical protein
MPRKRRRKSPKKPRGHWLRRRLEESVGTVRGIVAEPRSAGTMLHDGLLKIWRTRGGGFYGLGYLVCFVVLEVQAFVGNFQGNGDVMTMVVQEVVQFFLRFTAQSFLNSLLAFLWPAFVVEYLKGWGLVLIGVGWVVFDRWAKPLINAWLPGLKPAEPESQEVPNQSGEIQ